MIASDSAYPNIQYFLCVGFKVDEPRHKNTFDGLLDAVSKKHVNGEGLDQPYGPHLKLLTGSPREVRR
jgi:hypothetical protein